MNTRRYTAGNTYIDHDSIGKAAGIGCLAILAVLLLIPLVIAADIALTAIIVYYLWNLVIAKAFTLTAITWIQSLAVGAAFAVVQLFIFPARRK